ncbi:uncharacterized protein LOC129919581 [Episyrphus balteatus]|uniref:uncharacterized protein LOC129919581 n=1 Tax=Episyrphus balteatus TaxID=286459 RepID=UPI002484FDCD|nr:uncharacterized protein LOC129919581 [Episyrphus balteatus]XP_055856487.1 uncharacterized protein LOC129919581 [Episyrphus balteatus]XP_055856488.1 uncharacterized protein LOC129919581 [Episyrphus balteatus]XP_055856489.1 uncharacterized protein LOC129919581 [Episyrphus balteatus]
MIYIDDTDPEGILEPAFPPRDVTIKRGVDANGIYDMLSEVGRGKFGTVYRCSEKASGLKLAAKFVPIPKREDRRNVEREVEIMNSLQHHLIIQLYAAYEYQKMMCVVLELVEGGELFDRVIDDEFVLTERTCTVFIRQVCEAMQFIHRNNILHLDLKPENILCLTKEGNRIKIIDFGLARKFDPDKRLQILFGTPEFVAPEVVNFDCITYGTDMWSVGVICYVLLSGLSPFMGETDIETMANVTIAKYDFEDEAFSNVSPEALDFISKLLVKDCSTRMTATECLEHKWLKRRPKPPPIVSPKPTNVPPAKLKASTPSPVPADVIEDVREVNKTKELEHTKDNLKNFIERWEEHPNSPYVFDAEENVIAPLRDSRAGSISSSRVCSPSPCESLNTLADDDDNHNVDNDKEIISGDTDLTPVSERQDVFNKTPPETPTPTGEPRATSPTMKGFRGYLHSFDRRNSDTNFLLGRRSSGERINLADEIRKLSDHLLMLAEINTKLGNESDRDTIKETTPTNEDPNSVNAINSTSSTNSSSSSSVIKDSSSRVTNFTSNSMFTSSTSATMNSTKVSSLSVRLQKSIEETPKILSNGNLNTRPPTATSSKIQQNGLKAQSIQNAISSIATSTSSSSEASMRRAKFRVNQMSRDVPIGSPDKHQTVNLEEAANTTKDCLLHLLEKYNETKMRNPLGRHQSISIDRNFTDNLEYRSMSSINAFFQKQKNGGRNVKQLQAQLEGKTNNN